MSAGDVHTPTSAGPATDKSPTFGPPPGAPPTPPLERPEVQVGAAFAGGLLFALILKRLGG